LERPLPSSAHRERVFRAIAATLLAAEQTREAIPGQLMALLGKEYRWAGPLARRYLGWSSAGTRPRVRAIVAFLTADARLERVDWTKVKVARPVIPAAAMRPAAAGWNVPSIETIGGLAEWLGVTDGELAWFAELKGLTPVRQATPLGHYHYRLVAKAYGAIRLIEAPKGRLKEMQRKILAKILDAIPGHPAAHGFRRGRSVKTFAEPHVGRSVVLRMDLRDFFPTISRARLQAVFRTIGYPEKVADLLGGICTNAAPRFVWRETGLETTRDLVQAAKELYGRWHLPQGAPTSPALANLCAYRLDCRLHGLAAACGASYTRYADDIVFSGDKAFQRRVDRFSVHVAAIAAEEGFQVHHRKTKVMRQGVRQHIAGVVVNKTISPGRAEFDTLKAILTNCGRLGPEGQNREAHPAFRQHLEGRVAHMASLHPSRGERLRLLLRKIDWSQES
jgi:RNA-directed DNA polymerase